MERPAVSKRANRKGRDRLAHTRRPEAAMGSYLPTGTWDAHLGTMHGRVGYGSTHGGRSLAARKANVEAD